MVAFTTPFCSAWYPSGNGMATEAPPMASMNLADWGDTDCVNNPFQSASVFTGWVLHTSRARQVKENIIFELNFFSVNWLYIGINATCMAASASTLLARKGTSAAANLRSILANIPIGQPVISTAPVLNASTLSPSFISDSPGCISTTYLPPARALNLSAKAWSCIETGSRGGHGPANRKTFAFSALHSELKETSNPITKKAASIIDSFFISPSSFSLSMDIFSRKPNMVMPRTVNEGETFG